MEIISPKLSHRFLINFKVKNPLYDQEIFENKVFDLQCIRFKKKKNKLFFSFEADIQSILERQIFKIKEFDSIVVNLMDGTDKVLSSYTYYNCTVKRVDYGLDYHKSATIKFDIVTNYGSVNFIALN